MAEDSGSTSLSLKVRLLMITMVMVIWVVVRFCFCHHECHQIIFGKIVTQVFSSGVTANPNKPEISIRPNAQGYRVGSRMEVIII